MQIPQAKLLKQTCLRMASRERVGIRTVATAATLNGDHESGKILFTALRGLSRTSLFLIPL